jgi:hypothetical protein
MELKSGELLGNTAGLQGYPAVGGDFGTDAVQRELGGTRGGQDQHPFPNQGFAEDLMVPGLGRRRG